eukprot:TRINITY_DN11227_c0_g1_i1.p1 TRINITY_DN11227_c0_g1~~TRINITY_DN11227_c0_g1_i1.p1  ORF type:complete len:261 (-),score=54.51 TRINITY_DN11227_c0_g1_i1:96-878(-)
MSAVNISTKNPRIKTQVQINPTKKAYVRIHTNFGDLNCELHADITPRTCENFIYLLEMGFYDETIFHRLIPNFMVQGGDPTGTGTGGDSIYGGNFKDEFDNRLTHDQRGVLSMANSGPNSNSSQFFILFKSARHLDRKHTVFGKVVGGLETLTKIESVETDSSDRPKSEVKILGATIFQNAYKEMLEQQRLQIQMELDEEKNEESKNKGRKKEEEEVQPADNFEKSRINWERDADDVEAVPVRKQQKLVKQIQQSNFDSW